MQQGKLILRVQDDQVSFNIFKAWSFPNEGDTCYRVDTLTSCTKDVVHKICMDQPSTIGMVDVSKSTNPEVHKEYWAIKALHFNLKAADEKTKMWHDKRIPRKEFIPG